MRQIRKKIGCEDTLWLLDKILKSHSTSEERFLTKGIPIGNLTSQFFANIQLNGLDHFIKERLRCRHYLRYMDDFILLHDDKRFLWEAKSTIVAYLEGLGLSLHEGKCCIFKTQRGVPFLGMTIFPNRRRLKRQNVVRFKRRMRRFMALHGEDRMDWNYIHQSVQSWIGHASHADTVRLRTRLFEGIIFRKERED